MKNKLIKFIPALSVGMLFASLSPCIVSCFDNKNNKKSIVLQENKVKNFFEFLQNKAKNEPISNFNNEFGNFDEKKIQKFQEFLKALFDYKKTDIQSIHANQTDVTITPQDNVVFDLKGDVQKYCHLNDKHELVFSNVNFETDKDVTYQCDSKFEFNKGESKQLKISAKFDNHKLLGFSNKNLDFKWFYEDLNNELVPLLPSSEIVIKNSEQDSLITIDSKFLEKNFIIGKKHFICKINNSYIHLVKNDGCQIEIKENLDKVDIKKVVALLNNETNKSEYFDWKSTETTRTIDFNEKGLNKLSELLGFSNTNSIEKLINPIQNASLIVNENQTTEHTLLKLNIQLSNYFEFTNSVEQKISNQNEPKIQAKIGVYDRSQNFDIEDIALNIFNQKEIDHNTKKHININVEHAKNFFEFLQNKAKNEPISNFNNEFGNFDEKKIQKFQEFLKALFDYKKTDIQSIHANQTDVTITPQNNVVFDLKGDVQKYCHLNDKHELVFSNINFETDKDVTYQCETKFLFNDVLPKKLSINAQFNNIKMNYSNSIIPEFKWFYKTIDGTLEPLEPSQDIQINSSFDKSNISISSNYFLNNKMLGNLHFICKVDDSFIHFKNNNGCDIQLVWDIPPFDAQKVVDFLNNLTNKSEYLNWQNVEKIVFF